MTNDINIARARRCVDGKKRGSEGGVRTELMILEGVGDDRDRWELSKMAGWMGKQPTKKKGVRPE